MSETTDKFFERIKERRNEKDIPLENTLSQLENILDDWEVTFDEIDEKYIIKNCNNFNLSSEQLEWIYSIGLLIFNVYRYDEVVKISLYQKKVDAF